MASGPRCRLFIACWALILLTACSSSRSAEPARTGPNDSQEPAPRASVSGSWRRIAEAPVSPAGGMAAAWTGQQLVVWGGQAGDGQQSAGDGAVYDPAADRWEMLPASPLAARFGASAVWTGREVLFWGGQGRPDTVFSDGAAYDPATRRWRVLSGAPIGPRTGHQAVWTGVEMVVWGGIGRCCPNDSVIHDPGAAAYDPATDEWRRISDVPPPWSGDDGSAVTVTDGQRLLIWRQGHLGVYDSTANTWTEAAGVRPEPSPGLELPTTTADPFALGVSVDREVYTWTGPSGELVGLAWRSAEGSWRRTATLDGQSGASIAAGGPGRIYAAAGQSARVLEYRIADDRWEELPRPPISTRSAAVLVWTGSELLIWGGAGDESPEMDGAAWRPAG